MGDLMDTDSKTTVWEILQSHKGKANAISQHDLAGQAGLSPRGAREIVKLLIEEERRLICSNYSGTGGYYLPETDAELEETRTILKAHARSIFRRCQALGVKIDDLQMELFETNLGTASGAPTKEETLNGTR